MSKEIFLYILQSPVLESQNSEGETYASIFRPARAALLRMAVRAIWDGEKRSPASVITALLRKSSALFLSISGFSNNGYLVWEYRNHALKFTYKVPMISGASANGVPLEWDCLQGFKPTFRSIRKPSKGRYGLWTTKWKLSCWIRSSSYSRICSRALSCPAGLSWRFPTNWVLDTLNSSTLQERYAHVSLQR